VSARKRTRKPLIHWGVRGWLWQWLVGGAVIACREKTGPDPRRFLDGNGWSAARSLLGPEKSANLQTYRMAMAELPLGQEGELSAEFCGMS
jgi:hypothetical protein